MSFQAMAWAIKQRTGGPAAKVVLLCLANYADDKNQTFAGQNRIAEEGEMSLRTVRDSIKILEAAGLLIRERRRRQDGTRTTDLFTLPAQPANLAGSNSSTGRIRPINRQILPGKRDEPITEPITREENPVLKRKWEGLLQSLEGVIGEESVPRLTRVAAHAK